MKVTILSDLRLSLDYQLVTVSDDMAREEYKKYFGKIAMGRWLLIQNDPGSNEYQVLFLDMNDGRSHANAASMLGVTKENEQQRLMGGGKYIIRMRVNRVQSFFLDWESSTCKLEYGRDRPSDKDLAMYLRDALTSKVLMTFYKENH